jgi:hypothetical protein
LLSEEKNISLPANKGFNSKQRTTMQHTVSPPAPTLEDFSALLARGREIKERRMREARQQQKEAAAKSGYYDLEWV